MATGITKNGWKKSELDINRDDSKLNGSAVLQYEGKVDEQSIIQCAPCDLVTLWSHKLPSDSGSINRLMYGENLAILRSLLLDDEVRGKVRLVYIDPPFGTKSVFQSRNQSDAYTDILSGPQYIEFLRQRLILLRELLSDDGSIYVHLDGNMAFHIKVVMDEIFGPRNFRSWITRRKCNRKNYTRKTYGNVADFILFYSKTDTYVWKRAMEPWTEEATKREYQYIEKETGRRYKKVPIHAPGIRRGDTGKPWRDMNPPPGKHWQYTRDKLDDMDRRGEIYWSPTGNPRRKIYFDNSDGIPVQDIWFDCRDAYNQNISITGYPTEKNPDILRRIISASSNEGDLVLDCFSGSGTTLDVADELCRRWIGVDNSLEAITTSLQRFLHGTAPMGDFVSLRNGIKKNPTVDSPSNLSLFESGKKTQESETSTGRSPIINFSLMSEAGLASELKSSVTSWQEAVITFLGVTDGNGNRHTSAQIDDATYYLGQVDNQLGVIIRMTGPLEIKRPRDYFHRLCVAIISQQLSKTAAATIVGRVKDLMDRKTLSPSNLKLVSDEQLKSAGVSTKKLESIRQLSDYVENKTISLRSLSRAENEFVIGELTKVKGIGRWTAEMFLIFSLRRPDVFPLDDAGLRAAMEEVYFISDDAGESAYTAIADRWKPFRSIASRYLWSFRDSQQMANPG